VELLRGLPDEDVKTVLAAARRRRFARGDILFHQGDPAASLHVILRGRIAVRLTTPLGNVVTLDILVAGDTLGELALLTPGEVRNATAAALESTETMAIDRETFATLRTERPAVNDVLIELLARRLRRMATRLVEALYVPVDVRVFRRLVELADVYGEVVPLTQEDLAGLVGTTRATVNRVLKAEEKAGTVELSRGHVRVTDRAALGVRAR
jgi:CRP-like cAMP-binding protein